MTYLDLLHAVADHRQRRAVDAAAVRRLVRQRRAATALPGHGSRA